MKSRRSVSKHLSASGGELRNEVMKTQRWVVSQFQCIGEVLQTETLPRGAVPSGAWERGKVVA
jgi:hypothetical protein